jgi:hypothetical protein
VSAANATALDEPPLRVVIGNNAVSPIVATDRPMTHEIPQSRTRVTGESLSVVYR